jgi:hypothetical protein
LNDISSSNAKIIDEGILYNNLLKLRIDQKVAIYPYGFNNRPYDFSAHSHNMRVLSYGRERAAE